MQKYLIRHVIGVTPHAGVWIEIANISMSGGDAEVTPHAGVWIEIDHSLRLDLLGQVTPHAGVWIEILCLRRNCHIRCVTPHAGVWIEIKNCLDVLMMKKSLPTRECGLKYRDRPG